MVYMKAGCTQYGGNQSPSGDTCENKKAITLDADNIANNVAICKEKMKRY